MPSRRIVPGALLLCALLLPIAARRPATAAPTGNDLLRAGDGGYAHYFGEALALWGDWAAIGAPGWDNQHGTFTGAVYLYAHDGVAWQPRARLLAPDARAYEGFGHAIAHDGDTLAVAAPAADRGQAGQPGHTTDVGAVYIFEGGGAAWRPRAKLLPADLPHGSHFGHALALQDDTLLVSTPADHFNQAEAVYFYERRAGRWGVPQVVSLRGRPDYTPLFGSAVALAGDVALVGAPGPSWGDNLRPLVPGKVFVYHRDGGRWSPAGVLQPADGFPGDLFGCDIAFDGTTAVIAACQAIDREYAQSYATVYTRHGATWTQTARLEPEGDTFFPNGVNTIVAVELIGDTIFLGTPSSDTGPGAGRIFVYRRIDGLWTRQQPYDAPDGVTDSGFGHVIAANGHHFLAGAENLAHDDALSQGGVYVFDSPVAFASRVFAPVVGGGSSND